MDISTDAFSGEGVFAVLILGSLFFITTHKYDNISDKNILNHTKNNLHRLIVVIMFWVLSWSWYYYLSSRMEKILNNLWGMLGLTVIVLAVASLTMTNFHDFM